MPTITLEHRTLDHEELLPELRRRFGDNPERWAFTCPNCGDTATIADWRQALNNHAAERDGQPVTNPGDLIGQECIGRALGALEAPHGEWAGRGCVTTAYGLIPGPWEVRMPEQDDRPAHSIRSFPAADGDDPATAVHLYNPSKFGELTVDGTRIVQIPDKYASWGRSGPPVIVRTLRISDRCHCGEERGEVRGTNQHVDGEWYHWNEWENPCGHIDWYETLLTKAGLSIKTV